MADITRIPVRSVAAFAHDVPDSPAVLVDWRDDVFTVGIVPSHALFVFAIDMRVLRVDATAETHQAAIDCAYALARHLGFVQVVDRSLKSELSALSTGDAA